MRILKLICNILLSILLSIIGAIESVLRILAGSISIVRVKAHQDYDYRKWLKRDLADCQTVLELGCGANSPLLQIGDGKKTTAIEIFQPYVDMHRRNKDYYECHQGNILEMPFGKKLYDAVVICDVMEHLPREKVLEIDLFAKMEDCARKKVIIFTPNGYMPNDEVDADPYQAHVSAWEPIDYLRRGYIVKGATGLRYILGKASRPKYQPFSFFEIVAMLSQRLIYDKPEIAWHSYAIKEIK